MTWGNVVNGAGEVDGDDVRAVRRRRLVTDHEDVHVWQARAPSGRCTRSSTWLDGGRRRRRRAALVATRHHCLAGTVDAWGYYANPFEWWAYSRDGNWPPRSLRERSALVWRKPMTRPLRL